MSSDTTSRPAAGTDRPDDHDAEGRLVVDALGMACPRPILELAAAMKDVPVGDEVVLLADDPAAKVDVPAWARMKRQRVLSLDDVDGVITIVLRKHAEV